MPTSQLTRAVFDRGAIGMVWRQSKFSKTANLFAEVQVTLTCREVRGRGALLFFVFAAAVPPLTDEL